MNILVTGGGGFIGTHLVRRILREGESVAVLDNFSPQIHAGNQDLPPDLADHVELYRGDVRDRSVLCQALKGRDVVVHLAAETGTGQSMYEITRYQDVNVGGTAVLMDLVINSKSSISKMVVASSRAIYGEGKYQCPNDGTVYPGARSMSDLQNGQFEPRCPTCDRFTKPLPTTEDVSAHALSYYGLTKYIQEETIRMFGRLCGFAAYALRYQNVYGPGQSLRNPYTGILAIFSTLARAGSEIQVFEDGHESRDFVYIEDVVEATWCAISAERKGNDTFNVGSGIRTSVLEVAREIVSWFGSNSAIRVTGSSRQGDIRHNFADLTKVRRILGFEPKIPFEVGLKIFLEWVMQQDHAPVRYESSLQEMRERGLLNG